MWKATPEVCALVKVMCPSADVVVIEISSAASKVMLSPAFKSRLPAVAVIAIASAAVPVESTISFHLLLYRVV